MAAVKSKQPRYSWRFCVDICIVFCTLVIFIIGYGFIARQFDYVELPNGMQLKPTAWLQKNIVLQTSDDRIVVAADIDMVIWNDDYVAGWRVIRGKGNSVEDYVPFIYKIGDNSGLDGQGSTYQAYLNLHRASGLKSGGEMVSEKSMSVMTGYQLLLQDMRYRR
jgi:hypothetical protein